MDTTEVLTVMIALIIHPLALEICDDLDNNCNLATDGLNAKGEYVEVPIDGFSLC